MNKIIEKTLKALERNEGISREEWQELKQYWEEIGKKLKQIYRIIEPRIRVLVDALNRTGMIKTVSSCEGHLEETLEAMKEQGSFYPRDSAYVSFERLEYIEESMLEELFRFIYSDHLDSKTKWDATLSITKRYIACKETVPIESHYRFTLKLFDPHEPLDKKRAKLDTLIKEVAESVEKNTEIISKEYHRTRKA